MTTLTFIQGEAGSVTLTITEAGVAKNLTGATMTAEIGRRGSAPLVTIADASITRSTPTNGIATVPLSATDTDQAPGVYVLEVTTQYSATQVDINQETVIVITEAVGS